MRSVYQQMGPGTDAGLFRKGAKATEAGGPL